MSIESNCYDITMMRNALVAYICYVLYIDSVRSSHSEISCSAQEATCAIHKELHGLFRSAVPDLIGYFERKADTRST